MTNKWITVFPMIMVAGFILSVSLSTCTGQQCGDYTKTTGGTYTRTPNRGEYQRSGNNYVFVGCSRGGGFIPIFGGSSGGDSDNSRNRRGSDYRGGGPSWGK